MTKISSDKSHYLGHRTRLRQRLLESLPGSLPDYEILELILCLARPRVDMKPLAKMLINEYGSFARVINASQDALLKNFGVGESIVSLFRIIQEGSTRLIKEELQEKPIIGSWHKLLEYCRATMGHIQTEQFRVLYMDKKNMLIADELQQYGTTDQTHIYPREIVKRALYIEASAIIIVHNHPSGNTKPSKEDIEITKLVQQSCHIFGIDLHDHVIISNQSYYSFKSYGLL
jgi:DNA repair protein RadC